METVLLPSTGCGLAKSCPQPGHGEPFQSWRHSAARQLPRDNTGLDLPQDVHEHPAGAWNDGCTKRRPRSDRSAHALTNNLSWWTGRLVRLEDVVHVLLDLRKAYDTVWRDGLFYTSRRGVDGKLWRVLRDMFAKTSSRVRVNDQLSDAFP
jgi:hypothetical protein